MKPNQKEFIPAIVGLAIIVVLAVVGAGVWYLAQTARPKPEPAVDQKMVQQKNSGQSDSQPATRNQEPMTADDTEGWLAYRDEEYGFEIKYPAGYNAVELKSGSAAAIKEVAFYAPGELMGEEAAAIVLVIGNEPVTYAFHGTWAVVAYSEANDDIKMVRSQKTGINGIYFAKDFWSAANSSAISASAKKDQNYYSLVLGIENQAGKSQETKIFDRMLSTFIFVDSKYDSMLLELKKENEVFSDGSIPSSWAIAGFSDPEDFKRFVKEFQGMVAGNDKAKIAQLIEYPVNGIEDKQTFINRYDLVFNQKVKQAVAEQNIEEIWRNYQGAKIGNGEIWFYEIPGEGYRIIAINN